VIRRGGRYFDGARSRALAVELAIYADGTLTLSGDGVALSLSRNAVAVSPRLGHTPRVLTLPGGARCELADDDELDRALAPRDWRRRLDALERRAALAAASVVVTIAALAAVVQLGIPALARIAAQSLPESVETQLGDTTLAALDHGMFGASALPAKRRDSIAALFDSLALRARLEARLALRAGGRAGANAFTLPGRTVVMTDELVQLATSDDEIAAVLAHELGHVARQHALRSALQNAGVVVLVAATLGDVTSISSLAATLPTTLVELQYSRRFEREADRDAVALLADTGRDPAALATVLARLEQSHGGGGSLPAYLSTHPDTGERVREIRRAAKAHSSSS
jgi:predicted Zn-dependent protease